MATTNKHPNRFELTAVYRHPQARADIVLVHGLNGAPGKTWTAPNGVYWPADLLPASLKDEHANVLVYGYNADVYGGFWERPAKNPSENFIHHHAQTLVTTLTHYRKSEGTERNPIIWVAHSLGGIVTKRALLYSNDLRDPNQEDLRSIYVSTYGIIFLGTPHNGASAAAWGGLIQRMADAMVPKKLLATESVLLKSLKKDSETLQQISSHFLDIYQKFKIHMAHENQKTDVKGSKILVVDAASASPQLVGVTYYGIEATHSGMCKFESENAPGYRTVSTAIREWVAEAPEVIPIRWEVEEDQRRVRANLELFERSRLYNSGLVSMDNGIAASQLQLTLPEAAGPVPGALLTHAPYANAHHEPKLLPPLPDTQPAQNGGDHEPLFIHPEKFRPNSYFIGREDELRGLHEMLMDRKRRSEGTSAVLVQCLPGGGKTHLARQYVFKHKDDYPGGVYWVRAKSRHELEYWYWRIARNEALRGLVDRRDVEELRDPRKIVQIVRRWLSSQAEWLMVFDGVQFDTPGLHEFIPDARNTSLIYTSTERAVTGDPRFDNPQVMELGLLTAEQATELLLLETERKKPWSAEDQAMALELVGLMGRLPLMIHVAAQHLKATREPLARYLRSYRNRPKAGDLPAYKAVREQLENRGENAALNLMSLLVFFDQHVPVEMLALGISALDKVTPVKTSDATHRKPSLNITLKVLIAFALVERSESDDISPTSSRSSKRSFDRHVEYLDLLRIHSVVQAFFIDSLQEKRQIPFWLERAVAVWARSYDEADRRIQEDPRVGLPDDYRRFCIHGEKLLQNLGRFERRYPKLAIAKYYLESRLQKIQGQIDQLSQAIQKNIVDGSAEEYPASVFDRISASSQSDAATMQSHGSQLSRMGSLRDGDGELVQSPVAELLEHEAQWDTPYPDSPVMPPVPEITEHDDDDGDDDGDQDTLVLSVAGTQVHVGATDAIEVVSLPPDPRDRQQESAAYDDWHAAIPRHRVIRRQETRRYHDRAGAWRDSTVGDPRVGMSWEVAVGSIASKREASASRSAHVTAQSEAEMQLNKIKLAAPPSPKPRVASFGGHAAARPMTLVGRNSWAVPHAVKTPDTDVAEIPPEGFSNGIAQILATPKSWTSATIKKLKQTVLAPDKAETPQAPTPADDELAVPHGPIFRGSRSANSSPASHASPFPPPSFAGIPTDDLLAKPGVPLVVRRWDTVVYHPDGTPVASSGVEWASAPEHMSLSYPALLPSAQQHPGPARPAQPIFRAGPAAGYSSQPMSRDGSHRSSTHLNSPLVVHSPPSRSSSPVRGGVVPGGGSSSRHSPPGTSPGTSTQLPPTAGSQPIPTAGAGAGAGAFLTPFARARPPSYTETEPSPRLDTPFPDVDTSYQRWEQLHHRHRQRGGTVGPGTGTAAGGGAFARWRAGRGTRIARGGGEGKGRGKGKGKGAAAGERRSHSLSPSATPGGGGAGHRGEGEVAPVPVPWPEPGPSPSPSPSPSPFRGRAKSLTPVMPGLEPGSGSGPGLELGMGLGLVQPRPSRSTPALGQDVASQSQFQFPSQSQNQNQNQQQQQQQHPLAESTIPRPGAAPHAEPHPTAGSYPTAGPLTTAPYPTPTAGPYPTTTTGPSPDTNNLNNTTNGAPTNNTTSLHLHKPIPGGEAMSRSASAGSTGSGTGSGSGAGPVAAGIRMEDGSVVAFGVSDGGRVGV